MGAIKTLVFLELFGSLLFFVALIVAWFFFNRTRGQGDTYRELEPRSDKSGKK